MYIIGIDLSGPTNTGGTVLACFQYENGKLRPGDLLRDAGDAELYEYFLNLRANAHPVVGIDAPLSYNPGGGDRPAETSLRQHARHHGLSSGTIMPPTMTRMVYLTLRGIAVARLLQQLPRDAPQIVETHPASVCAFRGARLEDIRSLKESVRARHNLLAWLEKQGLALARAPSEPDDHVVCACAAALGAWSWYENCLRWHHPASPPLHPFDCAC